MLHVWARLHILFWWGDRRKRNNLEDVVVDGSIILKLIYKTWDGEA
jgi:hypothetical protein